MKALLLYLLLFASTAIRAQKIEAIYVNLYTDSLKKGTHNYINIDGQLSNGKYLPLDSTKILFTCANAKFAGNSIIIPTDFTFEKVTIKASLKNDIRIFKEFEVWVKKMEDPPLKGLAEIESKSNNTKKKKGDR